MGAAGNADVYSMRLDGTQKRNLTSSETFESAPDWGPDIDNEPPERAPSALNSAPGLQRLNTECPVVCTSAFETPPQQESGSWGPHGRCLRIDRGAVGGEVTRGRSRADSRRYDAPPRAPE